MKESLPAEQQLIDTGDTVLHGPSGEEWVVAHVDGDRLAWCGWPPGEVPLADCTLVKKAEPSYREKLLLDLANLQLEPGAYDRRKRVAELRLKGHTSG